MNLLHRGHDGTLPFDIRKKSYFPKLLKQARTAFSTIARNHRTRNISIQTILSDSNLYLSQHLLLHVRHLAPSSDYPLFKIIIITRKTSPSATMRGLPAAPTPRRSLRSPHPHTQLASLARTPTLLAPLALSPPAKCALQTGLNWPR